MTRRQTMLSGARAAALMPPRILMLYLVKLFQPEYINIDDTGPGAVTALAAVRRYRRQLK